MDEMHEDRTHARLLKRWPLRLFLKKISWLIIAVTGVALVILIGFSIYGNNVGDLIITVDAKTVRSLSLSETGAFAATDSTTLLSAEGIKNIRDSTYSYVPDSIREGNGAKSDKVNNHYFAYSFYLKNMSNVSIGYAATLKLEQVSQKIDEAIRIMILIDEDEPLIYARPKANGDAEELIDDGNPIKKPYTTQKLIGNEMDVVTQLAVEVDKVQKYTVVMWLEGWDADCNDGIIGGKLSLSLTFRILDSDE